MSVLFLVIVAIVEGVEHLGVNIFLDHHSILKVKTARSNAV